MEYITFRQALLTSGNRTDIAVPLQVLDSATYRAHHTREGIVVVDTPRLTFWVAGTIQSVMEAISDQYDYVVTSGDPGEIDSNVPSSITRASMKQERRDATTE